MIKKLIVVVVALSVSLVLVIGIGCAPRAADREVEPVQEEETDVIQAQTVEEAMAATGEEPIETDTSIPVTIGVIQITLEHEYQVLLNRGYQDQAAEMGAEVIIQVTELSPEVDVTAAEDLITAGVDAIIMAPSDPSSWRAVLELCRSAGIPLLNDGSPQPIEENVVPFIGTDSFGGGREAGTIAADWINENLDGSAIVVGLTLPTFTDCVARNEGFNEALFEIATGDITLIEENGEGLREAGLVATENILQAEPGVDVLFGCNDDSALGGMSAMEAAGKSREDNLVIGFDGTLGAFEQIAAGTMMRADIVQLPYLYAQMHMDRAVKLARGEQSIEFYQDLGPVFVETPVVTEENVDEWIERLSEMMP